MILCVPYSRHFAGGLRDNRCYNMNLTPVGLGELPEPSAHQPARTPLQRTFHQTQSHGREKTRLQCMMVEV